MSGHVTARAAVAAIVLSAVAGCSVAAAVPVAEPSPGSTAPIGVVAGDPSPVPPVRVTPTPTPTPAPEPVESKPEPKPTQTQPAKPEPKPEPKPTTPPPPPKPDTVTLSPITAYGNQAALDAGNLVTWWHDPCILAGHNTDGWAFLADIANGTRVKVTSGACAGTYEVYGHKWVDYRGSETMPDWTNEHDLILQSCVDPVGSGFSFARRIG